MIDKSFQVSIPNSDINFMLAENRYIELFISLDSLTIKILKKQFAILDGKYYKKLI